MIKIRNKIPRDRIRIKDRRDALRWLNSHGFPGAYVMSPTRGGIRVFLIKDQPYGPGSGKSLVQAVRNMKLHARLEGKLR